MLGGFRVAAPRLSALSAAASGSRTAPVSCFGAGNARTLHAAPPRTDPARPNDGGVILADQIRRNGQASDSFHTYSRVRRRPVHTTSTCSTSDGRTARRRSFHTSTAALQAGAGDFYKTLELGKSASQSDIKKQFYKLSKQWHPDVNQGSNESKQKFQEVSEAYATLSNEQDRRAYDRKISSSGFGSPRARTSSGGMRYASDNLERRQTASYAWDYQRRNAARQQRAASDKGRRAGTARDHYEHGAAGAAPRGAPLGSHTSMFERFAERQRKREEANAARMGASSVNASGAGVGSATASQRESAYNTISQDEHEAQAASGIVRFIQVTLIFSVIFVIASVGKSSQSPDPRRRRHPI